MAGSCGERSPSDRSQAAAIDAAMSVPRGERRFGAWGSAAGRSGRRDAAAAWRSSTSWTSTGMNWLATRVARRPHATTAGRRVRPDRSPERYFIGHGLRQPRTSPAPPGENQQQALRRRRSTPSRARTQLPDVVILMGYTHAISSVLAAIETAWQSITAKPPPRYILSNGLETADLLALVSKNDSLRRRILGTSPGENPATNPTGDFYSLYDERYRTQFDERRHPARFVRDRERVRRLLHGGLRPRRDAKRRRRGARRAGRAAEDPERARDLHAGHRPGGSGWDPDRVRGDLQWHAHRAAGSIGAALVRPLHRRCHLRHSGLVHRPGRGGARILQVSGLFYGRDRKTVARCRGTALNPAATDPRAGRAPCASQEGDSRDDQARSCARCCSAKMRRTSWNCVPSCTFTNSTLTSRSALLALGTRRGRRGLRRPKADRRRRPGARREADLRRRAKGTRVEFETRPG